MIQTDPRIATESVQEAITEFIKGIVKHPEIVEVKRVDEMLMAFQVIVSDRDCEVVLSKIDVLGSLGSRDKLLNGRKIFIQVVPC